jgi:hypothetical protein
MSVNNGADGLGGGNVYVNSSLQAGSSLRAPIFYDSDNTGYYLDPASGSNLNGTLINNGGTAMTAGWNRNLLLSSSFPVIVFNSASSKYSGIGVDYSVADSGFIFWVNGSSADVTGTGTITLRINTGNFVTAAGSFRAPIFYDSDNTGFYLDPASSSVLNGLNLTSGVLSLSGVNVMSRGGTWTEFRDPSGATKFWLGNDASIYMNASNYYLRSNDSSATFVDINSSLLQHSTSLRAPIFYDSNNTGYYGDFASTSVFNRIDTVRTNNWLYIDQNYGHCIVGLYNASRYQGVFAMGDSYKLPADGTSTGSLYGMAWSHPNAGGAAGNLTDHGLLIINNGAFKCAISNSIVASGNITAYSDERLKTNWRNMPKDYVNRLAQVKVGIYDRTDQEDVTQVGVSAQSFQKLLPEAIMTAKDDMQTLSVNYGGAALASTVELAKEVVDLRAKVERLEHLISKLIDV